LTIPAYFNWEVNPTNFSDQQIIYGEMICYGGMKMHQKIFARFFFCLNQIFYLIVSIFLLFVFVSIDHHLPNEVGNAIESWIER
jgi:hypothetical protein